MADDIAKRDFSVILKNLNRKVCITDCKWTEDRNFEIKFRTHINIEHDDYNTYCDNWADEFSQVTDTIWVHKISNTGPKVKFRKQYQCWTYEDKEVKKELIFDACRCRGTLDIKILGDSTPGSKKSNKYLRLGLNALIKINFYHLHPVDTTQSYSFFVHHCKPQPEPPKPVTQPKKSVSQLVAKIVANAAITSQKAYERAQKALQRQCIVPQLVHNMQPSVQHTQTASQVPQLIHFEQEKVKQIQPKHEPPVTQVLVDGQATETYYVQQVVFDSTTQTITEVLPVAGGSVPSITEHQMVQVQIPETVHISQGIETPHQLQVNNNQNVTQHF